jgi:DNA anti-recombination protein RmuC
MRTYRITTIVLMIVCAALLIHLNHQKNRAAEIVDQYFDLQSEYEKIFTEVQILEDYSQRLEEKVDELTNQKTKDNE